MIIADLTRFKSEFEIRSVASFSLALRAALRIRNFMKNIEAGDMLVNKTKVRMFFLNFCSFFSHIVDLAKNS